MRNSTSKRLVAAAIAAAMLAALVIIAAAPARAATATIADWQMNESAGAGTMLDSSGHGINGIIGSAVITGATYGGATGYRWPFTSPTNPPAQPERVVEVPNDVRLNPGNDDYAVTIRYRTTKTFGNIAQKGQGGSPGGYWKIENPAGIFTCVFRGVDSTGAFRRKEVNSGSPINDGSWHTVRCARTASQLTLTIDGVVVDTANGKTGSISNNRPLSIAGKTNCDQVTISCDYFTGDIDYLRIESASSAPPPPPPPPQVVFKDTFSTKDFSKWSKVKRLKIDDRRGGVAPPSARARTKNKKAWAAADLATTADSACVAFAVRVVKAKGATDLMAVRSAGNGGVATVVRGPDGSLRFRSDVSGIVKNSGELLPGGWNTVKLCGTVGSSGAWDLYLNGTKVISGVKADTGISPIARVRIGSSARETATLNYDDVKVTV
jgi:hypothetical protein